MSKRTGHTPMDFQFDNNHGAIDPQSPFITNSMSPLRQNSFQSKTRPYSSFATEVPSTPSRQASSQSFFSQVPSLKAPQKFGNPSFQSLRDNIDVDFSSGPENMSSPENADVDETPEPRFKSSPSKINDNVTVFRGNASPTKSTFPNLFKKHTSPGRGELRRGNHSDVLAKRVHKRKRRELESDNRIIYRRPSSDSESEDQTRQNSREGAAYQYPPKEVGFIPSIFSFIENHPRLPHVLSYYLQFLFNVFLVFFFMYLTYCFFSAIRQDVDMKSEESMAETLSEMAVCAREFVANKCEGQNRVPAMEMVCNNWEKCMNRDANSVGRAKVSAHTFAEIINGFFEPIAYKSMFFMLAIIFGCFATTNFAFGLFRNKTHPPTPPPPPQYAYPPPFPHQQHMSFPSGEHYPPPYQGRHMGMPEKGWAPNASGARMERSRSPSKRLEYH